MRCPKCLLSEWTCVLNTVQRSDGATRRRVGCRRCQIRWTTIEELEPGSITSAPVHRPVVPTTDDQTGTGASASTT